MITSVLRRTFNSRKKGTVHSCASSRSERFQISSLQIVYSLLWCRISITHCRAFQWAEAFSDSSARYMSILFQSNRNYSKFCACSGCMLYLMHIRSRTAPLVYLKICVQIGGFSWATHDWSRGWNSRQGDRVKTRCPRHLQRSCPLDNHSKICQLSVLSTWLIAWVLLAHANPPAVMRDFLSTNTLLFSIEFSAALLIPVFTVHEVKIWILMAMPPGCFGFQYPSKFKLVSSWGSLPSRRIPTDLFLWLVIDVLLLLRKLWTLFMPSSRSQHAPSATSDTLGSIAYYSITRVRISNTHLWRFWPEGINAARDPLHELVVLSQPFSKAAAEVNTSEFDPMDFDNEVAEGITHLDVSLNLFHKVDFSSLARCSRNCCQFWWLLRLKVPIMVVTKTLASVTTGLLIMLPLRHALLTACGSRHFQTILKNQLPSLSPRHGLLRLILQSNVDWRSIVSLQDSVPWQTYQDSPPNSGGS